MDTNFQKFFLFSKQRREVLWHEFRSRFNQVLDFKKFIHIFCYPKKGFFMKPLKNKTVEFFKTKKNFKIERINFEENSIIWNTYLSKSITFLKL